MRTKQANTIIINYKETEQPWRELLQMGVSDSYSEEVTG